MDQQSLSSAYHLEKTPGIVIPWTRVCVSLSIVHAVRLEITTIMVFCFLWDGTTNILQHHVECGDAHYLLL